MARQKSVDKSVEEIRKYLDSENLVIGTELTLKNLKLGKVSKVFLSSNCPAELKKDIEYYSGLSKATVVEMKQPNDELGVVCKKPFSISVLSLLKG